MIHKLLCAAGRHSWERRVNPETSGPGAVFMVCSRCDREKPGYEPPTPNQASGMSGGGV